MDEPHAKYHRRKPRGPSRRWARVEVPEPLLSSFNLFVALVLVGLNAFFVAAEFALVRVRESRIVQLEQEGSCAGHGRTRDAARPRLLPLRLPGRDHRRFPRARLGRRACRLAPHPTPARGRRDHERAVVAIIAVVARLLGHNLRPPRLRGAGAQVLLHPEGREGVALDQPSFEPVQAPASIPWSGWSTPRPTSS